jgi:hypothetical protein
MNETDSQISGTPIRWRLGILAALAMSVLAIYPQLNLWHTRGSQWNGSAASFDFDEAAYAAYLNALIEGRPRRNDPYTGHDDQPDKPQPESLFSIQFLPPCALALPARFFNLSGSTMFIIIAPLGAFASALVLFWLIALVTRDDRIAAFGTLSVLVLSVFAQVWMVLSWFQRGRWAVLNYPFMRRYIPLMAFPLFFFICALMWRSITATNRRSAIISACGAGFTFALLVYSYFFLWTASLAWIAGLALLCFIARPADRRRLITSFGIFSAFAIAALLPYALLLTHRAATMDAMTLLKATRRPEPGHLSEIVAGCALIALAFSIRRGMIAWRNPATVFTASFALVPFIVFNQQILTGRTLQPIHYDSFIGSYLALLACLLTATLIARGRVKIEKRMQSAILLALACLIFFWGLVSIRTWTRSVTQRYQRRDEERQVLNRFAQSPLNLVDGKLATRSVVLCTDLYQADTLATVAPQPVLWTQHMFVFSGLTALEHRQRLYQFLYYTGVDDREFAKLASERTYLRLSLFGWERNVAVEMTDVDPVSADEVEHERQIYADYIASFNRERAGEPLLSYLVTPSQGGPSLSNLDRWYERDAGEKVGGYTIYHLSLRP